MGQVFPNSTTFQIGDVNVSDTVFSVGKMTRTGMMNGRIKNNGKNAFTFSVLNSNDNGIADAYAALDILVTAAVGGTGGPGGTPVSSISVVPGGFVDFVIDRLSKPFIQFNASPQPGSVGQMTIYFNKNVFVQVLGEDIALPAPALADLT